MTSGADATPASPATSAPPSLPAPRLLRAAIGAAALLVLLAGAALRLSGWLDAPPGPWVDEAYALRAARTIHADGGAPLFGTTPLEPPEAGFVNSWLSNPYLAVASAVDRAAGGGMRSIRLQSVAPALLLLLASALLAAELLGDRPGALLACLALLSSSSWLLSTGRWGWNAVSTAVLLVLSAASAARARRLGSGRWSAAGGALLGAAQYGYVAAWLALPVPALLLAGSLLRRARGRAARGEVSRDLLLAGAAALVALPLGVHFAAHPERAGARAAEVGFWRSGAAGASRLGALSTLGAGVARNARLFVSGGDPNLRHGSPDRPVLPPLAVALALVGGVAALSGARGRGPSVALLFSALLLAGGPLAFEPGGANSYRISPAAPFLLVLAGVGCARLLEGVPEGGRRAAGLVLAIGVLLTAAAETRAFGRWISDPALFGWFGGPERELADAIRRERETGGPAETILDPGACRNPVVVEVLAAPPDEGKLRTLSVVRGALDSRAADSGPDGASGPPALPQPQQQPRQQQLGAILWAGPDGASSRAAIARAGGEIRAVGTPLPGFGRWILARIPGPAREAAP